MLVLHRDESRIYNRYVSSRCASLTLIILLITLISPQKNNENRVNIFIDGNYNFSLDLETLLKNKLKVNQTIDKKEIDRLIKESEFLRFYNLVLNFLSFRPRSENEVKFYLKKKKIDDLEIETVILKLKEKGLIDDFKFSRWFIDQRRTFRPKSKRLIEIELLKKGVDKKVTQEVFSNYNSKTEKELAKRLTEKGYQKYLKLPPRERKQKLTAYLLQRGFEWETVKAVIDEFFKKE